jgi:hypothetical protein
MRGSDRTPAVAADRLDLAPPREAPAPNPERLRSLAALLLRLAREDRAVGQSAETDGKNTE